MIKLAIGLIVLTAAGFLLLGAVFCRATLHVAKRMGTAPSGAATVTIVAGDKAVLSAWWMQPQVHSQRCVVVLHGIGDSRVGSEGFAPMFLRSGYAVLLPDSRAHGASGGSTVTYGLVEKDDVIAWATWMKSAGCQKIYGLGESLGASILIDATAVQPAFSAIVAEGAYADLREAAEHRLQLSVGLPAFLAKLVAANGLFYAKWIEGLDFTKESPLRSIARSSTPTLLIHGLKDFRTPPSNSERLKEANPRNALWLVPHALHTGAAATAPEEFERRVLGWFATHS